eukprot:TRINITY_DN73420_c0_g1_i1.p1 TRINITY_DN73420_c0_g1~~TRINITY_DN73420_c0_g1_i1.p1  ORF type:complete len:946 (-),score=231.31 TRINITY_DN73420_c0_g1_i1:58-2895(-)
MAVALDRVRGGGGAGGQVLRAVLLCAAVSCLAGSCSVRGAGADLSRAVRSSSAKKAGERIDALAFVCPYGVSLSSLSCRGRPPHQPYSRSRLETLRRATQTAPIIIDAEEVVRELDDDDDVPSRVQEAAPQKAKRQGSVFDCVIAGGGLAGLWLAVLLASGQQRKLVRLRIYDPRWRQSVATSRVSWLEGRRSEHCEAVTVAGHIWNRLPEAIQKRLFPKGSYVEQWPKLQPETSEEATEARSRSTSLATLEEALLDVLQDETLIGRDSVELRAGSYDGAEHQRVTAADPYHVVVAADGVAGQDLRDTVAQGSFENPRQAASMHEASALAVRFDRRQVAAGAGPAPLDLAACTALSLSQSRYFLVMTGEHTGVLYMRLTRGEIVQAESLIREVYSHGMAVGSSQREPTFRAPYAGSSDLWLRLLEGFKLYGLAEGAACGAAYLESSPCNRSQLWASLQGLNSPSKGCTPLCFLLGETARGSAGGARVGFAAGAHAIGQGAWALESADSLATVLEDGGMKKLLAGRALDRQRLSAYSNAVKRVRDREQEPRGFGPADRIEVTLAKAPDGREDDIFLSTVASTLDALELDGALPPLLEKELPKALDLCKRVRQADFAGETWGVLAFSGAANWLRQAAAEPQSAGEGSRAPADDVDMKMMDFGGETAEGLEWAAQMQSAAEVGDVEAQMQLGVAYMTANGVRRDSQAALRWLRKAAESEFPPAQNCIGSLLSEGADGVAEDKEEAFKWFQRAAANGDVEGQYNLASSYWDAAGVERNVVEAVKWLERASEQGLGQAQFQLGMLLHEGDQVPQDQEKAVMWLKRAAGELPTLGAAEEMGEMAPMPEAMRALGMMSYTGEGVPLDKAAAVKYFQQAAELGDPEAQYSLGLVLELGDGLPRDLEESQKWLVKAAAQGHVEAQALCRRPVGAGGVSEEEMRRHAAADAPQPA